MPEQEKQPETLAEIMEGISRKSEISGIEDSLRVEGIEVPEEFIRKAVEERERKNDGATKQTPKSDA
jgi:hypothetical protein